MLAGLFILGALVRAGLDWTASGETGFRFAEIGTVWAETHLASLAQLQPALERYLWGWFEWVWDPVLLTVLLWPMAPVLTGLGALLLLPELWRKRG
ncbi:MAG: hypothetical protein AAFW69_02020 [Pseudomonadota bacterium]